MLQMKLIVIILFCFHLVRARVNNSVPSEEPHDDEYYYEYDDTSPPEYSYKYNEDYQVGTAHGGGPGHGHGFEHDPEEDDHTHYGKPCQVLLPCKNNSDIAYGSSGKNCLIFQNACKLRNENCRRHNVYLDTLELVSYKECKFLCTKKCSDVGGFFCAGTNTIAFTFMNECEWNAAMCIDNVYYRLLHTGKCEPEEGFIYDERN